MFAVVAVDDNWAIGKNGTLLCSLKPDMKNFRSLTLGKAVLMGRKTLMSFPDSKPLPKRKNYVITHDISFSQDGVEVVNGLDEAKKLIEEYNKTDRDGLVCIGGASVYTQLLDYTDYVIVTRIFKSFEGADCYFPNLEESGWKYDELCEIAEYEGVKYQFRKYYREKGGTIK